MTPLRKRCIRFGIGILAAITVLREAGLVNLNAKSSSLKSSLSVMRVLSGPPDGTDTRVDLKAEDYTIRPSLLDYVPFIKFRTFKGGVGLGHTDGADITLQYEIEVSTFGFCSAREFRAQVRQFLDQKISGGL